MRAGTAFATIRTEGAILPPDILNRIAAGDKDLGGLTEADLRAQPDAGHISPADPA